MSKIVVFPGPTRLDIPADLTLNDALECELDKCIVLAYDKSGEEYIFNGIADAAETLWLLERAKKKLLEVVE